MVFCRSEVTFLSVSDKGLAIFADKNIFACCPGKLEL